MNALLLLIKVAAASAPDSALAVEQALHIPWDQKLSEIREQMSSLALGEAMDSAHATAESVRAARDRGDLSQEEADALLSELDRIWGLARELDKGWHLLAHHRYEEAAHCGAISRDTARGLSDHLTHHAIALESLANDLEGAEVDLAWGAYEGAAAEAQSAALSAWTLFLEGALTQDQLDAVEAESALIRSQALRPVNFVAEGQRGVATLAIQHTDLAGEFSPELYAFVRTLSYVEGTETVDGYWIEVGGTRLPSDTVIHPGLLNPRRYRRTGFYSDAFGRYQMLSTTWAIWARDAGVPVVREGVNEDGYAWYDFSPEYQDLAVLRFLQREGLEEMLVDGNLWGALYTRAARQWTSVPGGYQPNGRTGRFVEVYEELLKEEQQAAELRGRGKS